MYLICTRSILFSCLYLQMYIYLYLFRINRAYLSLRMIAMTNKLAKFLCHWPNKKTTRHPLARKDSLMFDTALRNGLTRNAGS